MKLRYFALMILLALSALLLFIIIAPPSAESGHQDEESTMSILEVGRAGDYGYVTVNYRGSPTIRILSFNQSPIKKVTLLNESESMAGDFAAFATDLDPLKDYGIDFGLSSQRVLGEGIYVIPTGAMPSYALDDLRFNATEAKIIYVGATDLLIDDGVKKEDWYSPLGQDARDRLVIYNTSPDLFLEGNNSLMQEILENSWAVSSRSNATLSGSGKHTLTITMGESDYLRIIYEIGNEKKALDSVSMPRSGPIVSADPQSIYPWEKTSVSFSLNKTNGTAFLEIWQDASQKNNYQLSRVTDQNYFEKRLEFDGPGEYVLKVTDNSGTIASGLVHVYDLNVSYLGVIGTTYLFNVTVDGKPLNNEPASVHLSNSSVSKDYFVSQGLLSIPARLKKGDNTFNIRILGNTYQIDVTNSQEDFAEVYLKYGLPGLLLVLAVFFGARMSRRPLYTLRVGEAAGELRKDVRISQANAIQAFEEIRSELGLGRSPITAHEFSIALKRHITDGADVTEGNVEEILQSLVKKGELKSHRQHYQLKGEGDIRKNTLVRMIRDQLIESGIRYRKKGDRFITEHFEIGFFGGKFKEKAFVIVENQDELDSIFSSLDRRELAKLKLKVANGKLRFVKIDGLKDVL